MRKHIFTLAVALMGFCMSFTSCEKTPIVDDNDGAVYVGVYDFTMVYDSVTTSDGTWFSEEDYEFFTNKVNPPKNGYLTITDGDNGKLNLTATFIESTGKEKQFFATTASVVDGDLKIDDCTSDYYYSSIEDYIRFVFRNFSNNMPNIYFKSVYTINLGADYSYLTHYDCVKRD